VWLHIYPVLIGVFTVHSAEWDSQSHSALYLTKHNNKLHDDGCLTKTCKSTLM